MIMSNPDAQELLAGAQLGATEQLGDLLQLYRNYLTILASTQLNARIRRRVSSSDVVQDAMLAAHRDFGNFRGQTEREFLAWLRQVLINTIHHTVDAHVKAQRRDVRREVSLEQFNTALDRSAANFAAAIADPGPSPSAVASKREAAVVMADQLAKLPENYREVIVLRNLQGLSFDEVAERLDRSSAAARMLWLRAIKKLKEVFDPDAME